MAARCPGFTGADIGNVCNEAALIAARKNRDAVEQVIIICPLFVDNNTKKKEDETHQAF